jgi:alpha-ketoglutarate-dependent taurine dioxygenase
MKLDRSDARHGAIMTYEAISVTPCSPHVGAEIGDIDLTRPLSNQQVAELHQAFTEHLVIFFRDQRISFEDQIRVAGYFGPLGRHVGVNTISKTTENPFVRKFHYDETSKKISGENWHSDQSCAAIPPLGSMLYNHTLPPNGGGDTMFASMYAAYDAVTAHEDLPGRADGHARRDARVRRRNPHIDPSGDRAPSRQREEVDLREHGFYFAHQRASPRRG